MPQVKVRLLPVLSNIAEREDIDVNVERGTLRELIDELCNRHGDLFKKVILDSHADVRQKVRITLNRKIVELKELNSIVLKDGDEVVITPPRSI